MTPSKTPASSSSSNIPDFANGTNAAVWHKTAPDRLRKTGKLGDAEALWSVWSAYLAGRKKPESPNRLDSTKRPALLWALPEGIEGRGTRGLIERLATLARKPKECDASFDEVTNTWMADASASRSEPGYALEAIAFARALPQLAGVLPASTWWALLKHLVVLSVQTSQPLVEPVSFAQTLSDGELALTLAYQLPELVVCRKLVHSARRILSIGLEETLDGEGLPQAKDLSLLRPLLACWTRCQLLGRHWKKGCFSKIAESQFEWAVRQALRWTRADGSVVFSKPAANADPLDWMADAMCFDDDPDDHDIATIVLPGSKKSKKEKAAGHALPEAAGHSEWSTAAVLRPEWPLEGPHLSILYPGNTVQTELSAQGELVWSGQWTWEVLRNGKRLEPVSDWQYTCWVSDEDADFLELEIELSEGLRIQRQMVMGREDRFLLMADAILGDEPARLEYRGCLPLSTDFSITESPETREVTLCGTRRSALVVPLALPEWQCDDRVGSLCRTKQGLELRQSIEGASMYCPLWFDFNPRRMTRRMTWRQLTVAADLEVQPADVAAGYRVQVGAEQWLVYRSLAERANRTLLGHNLSTETLVARFDEQGEVEPLVEVE